VKRFGDLIALLRADPGNDAAQDLALTAAAAAVEKEALEVEAGVEWSVIPDDLTLKGRLIARQVELIRIAAGAEPHELLALARALSHDHAPIPSSSSVVVVMVEPIVTPPPRPGPPSVPPPHLHQARGPSERRSWLDRRRAGRARYPAIERRRRPDRRTAGERRLSLIEGQQAEIARLQTILQRSARTLDWDTALAAAVSLVHLVPRLPAAGRRGYAIQIRRAIPRPVVEGIVDLAERDVALRDPAAEVLRWVGLDAAEAIVERLVQGEAVGARTFYYDVLGGMPGAYPLVTRLLASHRPHEVRHGAVLLGRLGQPAAIAELAPLMAYPDESVRVAVVRAIGEIHDGPAAEPLRHALHHGDHHVRAAAAEAIAVWRGGALALLLVSALETERDRDAWQALLTALGRLGTFESAGALGGVALARRSLLRRHGYSTGQRLAAVEALSLSDSPPALTTLERLARDAEGVIRYAADRILQAERRHAG
jgi:hypothetical protein